MKPIRVHNLPLHPMLVHFPVAAWTVATGLALLPALALLSPLAPTMKIAIDIPRLAQYTNAFGVITGAVAMLAGLVELASLPADRRLRDAIARHLLLACSAWLAYCVMWVLQVKTLPFATAAAGLVGFALLIAAGHAGARVVYHHGFPRRSERP